MIVNRAPVLSMVYEHSVEFYKTFDKLQIVSLFSVLR